MALYIRARLMRTRIHRGPWVRFVQQVLSAVGEEGSELSIELIGDRRMRRLNRVYRNKDRSTDVLAFAMREAISPDATLLGDVIVSIPTARRQALQSGRSLDQELAVLVIHGVLHLCGYDHERSEREARRMRRKERTILRTLGPLPRLVSRSTAQTRRTV